MQRAVQVPSALVIGLNGLVVVFVVSSELWRRVRQRRRLASEGADTEPIRRADGDSASGSAIGE